MPYRVLIVDDSQAMRSFVRRVLEVSGFDLAMSFEAENGAGALELLRTQWVDAILADINMPGMDGEEFLRRLKSDELLRSIPVIIISADATQSRMERTLALGAGGYVTKPFRPEALRAQLEASLGVSCA